MADANFNMGGATLNLDAARACLKQVWGYDAFRLRQEDIVAEALAGKDVLAVLPTGGGKSICFQVPALLKEGVALVITPLISLMKDQVRNLEARGIKAAAVTYIGLGKNAYSGETPKKIEIFLDRPFVYMLMDNSTNLPLFVGVVNTL